jgi:hypothetical protein
VPEEIQGQGQNFIHINYVILSITSQTGLKIIIEIKTITFFISQCERNIDS